MQNNERPPWAQPSVQDAAHKFWRFFAPTTPRMGRPAKRLPSKCGDAINWWGNERAPRGAMASRKQIGDSAWPMPSPRVHRIAAIPYKEQQYLGVVTEVGEDFVIADLYLSDGDVQHVSLPRVAFIIEPNVGLDFSCVVRSVGAVTITTATPIRKEEESSAGLDMNEAELRDWIMTLDI
jgi:hypothetical protein